MNCWPVRHFRTDTVDASDFKSPGILEGGTVTAEALSAVSSLHLNTFIYLNRNSEHLCDFFRKLKELVMSEGFQILSGLHLSLDMVIETKTTNLPT